MRTLRFLLSTALAATFGTAVAHADCSLQSLGTVPGSFDLIASSEAVAIVAAEGGTTVTLLDVTGATPAVGGTISATGGVTAVAISVADLKDLVQDPTGQALFPTSVALVGAGTKLSVYNVDELSQVGSIATVDLTSPATAISYEADRLRTDDEITGWIAVAESSVSGTGTSAGVLEIFELSTTGVATRIFQYAAGTNPGLSTGYEGVAYSGSIYVAVGAQGVDTFNYSLDSGGHRVYAKAGHQDLAGGATDVASTTQGGVFVVTAGSAGYLTLSATSPDSPNVLATMTTSAPAEAISSSGSSVAIALGSAGYLLVDVATPASPRTVASQDTAGDASDVAFVRAANGLSMVLVADGAAGEAAYDVTFCLCSHVFGSISASASAIAANDRTIYGVDGGTTFFIAQVGNGVTQQKTLTLSGSAVDVAAAFPGRYAYVAENASGTGRLEVVNANSVQNASVAGSLDLPFIPTSIVAETGFAFIGGTSGGKGILWVVSTSNAAAPAKVGELTLPDTGSGIADLSLEDTLLAAAAGTSGLVLIDVSSPSSPARLGSYSTGETASAVDVFDDYGYVYFTTGHIDVVDIRVPTSPAKISSIAVTGVESLVAFFGRVVATRDTLGVSVYDVVDPAHPGNIETIDTAGAAKDATIIPLGPGSSALVVADGNGGLLAVDVSACTTTASVPVPAFTSNPAPANAGEAVTFTDTSLNRPIAWSWNFGDGGTATAQNPTHTFASAGVYKVTLTATNLAGSAESSRLVFVGGSTGSPAAGGTGGANIWYIPASARAAGLNNTQWTTDAVIFNRSGVPAQVYLAFLSAGRSNLGGDPTSVLSIPAGSTVELKNVVEARFGLTSAAGGIQVASDSANLVITSRTFNSGGGSGTYGQYIPGYKTTAALTSGRIGYLVQLSENDEFRTNIGFQSASGNETVVQVRLMDSNGALLSTQSVTVPPFGYVQKSAIFQTAGVAPQSNARAEIQIVGGTGPLFGYASIVDNRSGDPIYEPLQY